METPGNCVWVSLLERKECKDPEIKGVKITFLAKNWGKGKKKSHSAPDNPALTAPSPSPRKSLDPPPHCVHPSQISPRSCVSQVGSHTGRDAAVTTLGTSQQLQGTTGAGEGTGGAEAALPPWPKGEQLQCCQGRAAPVPWHSCHSRALTWDL